MKVLLAFIGGGILAFGIAFVVLRKDKPAEPVAVESPVEQAKPAVQEAPPPEAPEPRPSAAAPGAAKKPAPKVAQRRAPQPEPEQVQQPPPVKPPEPKPAPPPPPSVETAAEPAVPFKPEPKPIPPPEPRKVELPTGTLLTVRLGEQLSTERSEAGDTFAATLDQPLVADGFVIAERGARVEGRVVEAERAGRVKGVAQLGIQLVRLNTSDGQRVAIQTETFRKEGPETKKEDVAKVGAAAGIGAAIGAIAGGGKGAAVGAAVGGAAGTGGVMATRGKPAELEVETRISFRLEQPVTITEKR